MQGLRQLEYREYDSSGVAVHQAERIHVYKTKGKLANLEAIIPEHSASLSGIAHTRWATHGRVSDANAHSHLSLHGKVAVVYNGIIDILAMGRLLLVAYRIFL